MTSLVPESASPILVTNLGFNSASLRDDALKPPEAPPSLINEYFELTKTHQKNYGENTVVLMQVGAFFEIYGLKDTDNGNIFGSKILDICQICQLNYSEKKVCVGKSQVIMAGYREYSLEKYLPKITEAGYTAVVYVQEKNGKVITRRQYGVYSAGTYVSCEVDSSPQITNNIMCIWFELVNPIKSQDIEYSKRLIYGVSVANIFTGESSLFEYECPFHMNPTTFDELERCVSVFAPSEIVVVSPFEPAQIQTILQYSGVKGATIHKWDTRDQSDEKVQNCTKQKYIHHILTTFYGEDSIQVCDEFNSYALATQSFCYLLNFIQEHNQDLVRKISLPRFNNSSKRLILANHTLKQLNIIDDSAGRDHGQLSSVASFLNKCCTSMGKRLFQYQITNPTFDVDWLQGEYTMIGGMLKDIPMNDAIRKKLVGVRDLEKNCRQLVLRKLYPSSIFYLYKSIETVRDVNALFSEIPELCLYLSGCKTHFRIRDKCDSISGFLSSRLNIEACRSINSLQNFENNIICPGVSTRLDDLLKKQETNLTILNEIKDYFNMYLRSQSTSKNTDETEYIKIHETEKSGKSLQITKKRGNMLKTIIVDIKTRDIELDNVKFSLNDVKFSSASTSMDEIHFPILSQVTKDIYRLTEEINTTILYVYQVILNDFERLWFSDLDFLSKYAAKLDVLQSKTYIAHNYNYCCPEILCEGTGSFVRVKEIRHALIEHINQNELYVTNDMTLDEDKSGMLLYGTNAVGKTSLIRALGIAVVMAQSGMFVPCSKFEYRPYTAIYSRILSNDNLFKGLSTFAVEMSELRVILKMADENSLILGDELASGTENESALSIFVASLLDLDKKKCCYVFATHFHEITQFEEIQTLEKVGLSYKHLSVYYDRELDCLVYDRKLKDGQGSKIYGLEVCSSLHLPKEFMDMAFQLRNRYFPESRGELSHQPTRYNAQKIRSICELCKCEIATEIHHLAQQKDATTDGFIGSFHKNHVANLAAVCEQCHLKMHHTDEAKPEAKKQIRKKTTKGYVISELKV
jgi:DNA mismatch repair protein MutS